MRIRLAKSRLLWLALTIAIGIGLLVTEQLLESRRATWKRAEAANANLLFTVSHVLERTLRSMDLAMQHTVAQLQQTTDADLPQIPDPVLFRAVPEDGLGVQLILNDAGQVIRASHPIPRPDVVLSDRSYFRSHQGDTDAGLFVSAPFQSQQDGQYSMALSRRWIKVDGSFGGVVVQTLKLSSLRELFSAIELGPDSGINLFLRDGTIVMRFPYTGTHIGTSLAGTANFERFVQEKEGSFTGIAALDKVERLYTFRTLAGFPLLINTAQSADSILHNWRNSALWLSAATLALMLACVGLAVLAERELQARRRTLLQLRRAENDIRTVVDSLPAMVAYWDDTLHNRFSNVAHKKWFGLTPQQIKGQHMRDVIGAPLFETVQRNIDLALSGHTQVFELAIINAKGNPHHTVCTFIPDTADGSVCGFFVLVNDISDRKAFEHSLAEEKERFRITLESINEAVITTDNHGRITYQNPAAERMTGWPLDQAFLRPVEDILKLTQSHGNTASQINPIRLSLAQRGMVRSNAELVVVSRMGQRTHIEDSAVPIIDKKGELRGAVLVFHEVGQARALAHKMTHLAQHDALTGLPNRRLLQHLASQALTRARRHGGKIALLFLDLDGFKQINDTYGHAVGDELLIAVSRRLEATLRVGDTVCRKGGDEFIILMDGVDDISEPAWLATRLIERCRQSIMIEGRPLNVTSSIGISLYPDHANEFELLERLADKAMYAAKAAGRDQYAYFEPESAAALMVSRETGAS